MQMHMIYPRDSIQHFLEQSSEHLRIWSCACEPWMYTKSIFILFYFLKAHTKEIDLRKARESAWPCRESCFWISWDKCLVCRERNKEDHLSCFQRRCWREQRRWVFVSPQEARARAAQRWRMRENPARDITLRKENIRSQCMWVIAWLFIVRVWKAQSCKPFEADASQQIAIPNWFTVEQILWLQS